MTEPQTTRDVKILHLVHKIANDVFTEKRHLTAEQFNKKYDEFRENLLELVTEIQNNDR